MFIINLEQAFTAAGIALSVLNPRQIVNCAKSRNRRNKTHKVDALLLAEFGWERHPEVSTSTAPAQQSITRVEALNSI